MSGLVKFVYFSFHKSREEGYLVLTDTRNFSSRNLVIIETKFIGTHFLEYKRHEDWFEKLVYMGEL